MRHRRTQEALLRSALHAPEILEFMSEGFISFDRQWKYRYINRRAEEIFGVSRDNLVGRSLSDAYPGAVGEEFRSLVRRADRERVALSFEGKHPILDRVYQSNVYPTLDGVAVFFRDITAEKHSDEARNRLAERLEMAQRAAMAADWRWNFQTGKMDCSSNFGEVLGFGPDEPITRDTWVGHVHPAEREGVEASVKEIAKGSADRFQLEYRILGSDGQSRWMQSRGMLERSADGKATGAVGITLDITEKKMAELALRESEERFRTLSEVVPQLVWQADADGLIDYWNQRTYAYTGQTAPEAAGWGWAAAVHPEDRARVAASWEAAIKEQAIFDIEYRIRRHDGEYRWFVDRGQPVRDDSGRIVRWFGTCTDITYRRSVETALQESEQRYRAIFEQACVGVALVALDGRYLETNSRFCEITGYSQEELRHLSFRDLTHPDDLPSSLEQTDMLIAGLTERCALKNRHIRKDGRITWMYVTHALVRNAPGRPQYMIWVIEDINDRERIQLQLQEQSQRLEAALTASKTGTFRWDVRTNEFQADKNLHRLFGIPPDETARGLDEFNSLIVAEDRARVVECRNRAVREGGHFENVFRVIWPDGTLHWLRDRGKTFFDMRGQPANMTGACVEITEHMEAQQQLEKTQELLLLAQAAAGVGTLEWDLITGRGRESPEMYRMYGISEQQDPFSVKERLQLIHPDDRPKIAEVWERLVKGEQDNAEAEFRVGSGPGMRWVSWRGHVLRDGAGRAIRIIGAGFDVTERRRAEQILRTHEKLTATGRLSTSIAHELNNPLETVANVLHLIRNCSSLEEVQKYSRIGERELQRIIHTTRQTLRFHHQSAYPIPIKVSAIVDAIAGLYEHRFHGANIELKREFRDTQPITCFADDLRQLFGNLISNALDATPAGGRVVLRVSEETNYRTGEPGRRVLIADTGHGMSREVKDRLFEPFSSTKDLTGIGLGLWISFGIVKRHGGTIRIRSGNKENRHGTVVSVFLPARPSHVAARRSA